MSLNKNVNFKITCDTFGYVNGLKRALQKQFQYYMLCVKNVSTNTILEKELIHHKFKYVYLKSNTILKSHNFILDIKCDKDYMMVFTNSIKVEGLNFNQLQLIIPQNIYLFTLKKNDYIKISGKIQNNNGRLIGNMGWKHHIRKEDKLIEFFVTFNHFSIYPTTKIIELGKNKERYLILVPGEVDTRNRGSVKDALKRNKRYRAC